MGHRKSVLAPLGYDVTYGNAPKYGGTGVVKHCMAAKDGLRYFAFIIGKPDHPDHFKRIVSVQDSIPHMVRMSGPFEDIVLLEEARGQLLWHIDPSPPPALVESQLELFALATQRCGLIHGDLRPWNMFFDGERGIQVIDWWLLSCFRDSLENRADLVEGHYTKFHPDLVRQARFGDIDLADVQRIGRLLRGEIGLSEAWSQGPRSHYPSWCKP